MSDWRRDLEREVIAAGGVYHRSTKHGRLYRVFGTTFLIGQDQSGDNWRERGNSEAGWKRLKRLHRERDRARP